MIIVENEKEIQMIKALVDYPLSVEDINKIKTVKELKSLREIIIINYKETLERIDNSRKV